MKDEIIIAEEKPVILKAIELILADPIEIKNQALQLKQKYATRYGNDRSEEEVNDYAVEKIISNYSYYAAFVGGASSLAGVIPGLGTAISTFGGAAADAALSMKYQIEMTMAIATIYGHDILNAEGKNICLIVAGLGAINEAAKDGSKEITKKAFIKLTNEYLKGPILVALKEIFRKVGITFTRKAVEKAIPFGVGVIIGFSANKGLTWYVGTKAKDFFSVE